MNAKLLIRCINVIGKKQREYFLSKLTNPDHMLKTVMLNCSAGGASALKVDINLSRKFAPLPGTSSS